jgi:hypothetical protein
MSLKIEELKKKLIRLVNEAKELTSRILLSRVVINELCLELASLVDLAVETRLLISSAETGEKLNEARREWLKAIGEYEKSRVAKLEESIKSTLIESINKASAWAERLLQNMERKENFLTELNQQTDQHLRNFKHLGLQMLAFQVSGELMTFSENRTCNNEIIVEPAGFLETQFVKVPALVQHHFKNQEAPLLSNHF